MGSCNNTMHRIWANNKVQFSRMCCSVCHYFVGQINQLTISNHCCQTSFFCEMRVSCSFTFTLYAQRMQCGNCNENVSTLKFRSDNNTNQISMVSTNNKMRNFKNMIFILESIFFYAYNNTIKTLLSRLQLTFSNTVLNMIYHDITVPR